MAGCRASRLDRSPNGGPAVSLQVCFVCTGNICRSPMAEVVLRTLADRTPTGQGSLGDQLEVSSAGTGPWHVGEAMDPRAADVLVASGYLDPGHRARQFQVAWLDQLDLVVCLDRRHLETLRGWPDASWPSSSSCGASTRRPAATSMCPTPTTAVPRTSSVAGS